LRKKQSQRIIRHQRIRKKIFGTDVKPRISVFRSRKNIYAQIIDDQQGRSLVSVSTLTKELKDSIKNRRKTEASQLVGELLAKRALEKNIREVVFDRSGYLYHGRVKALAEGARKGGLQF